MSDVAHGSPIIPGLRYHDAEAAIEWLCRVFGFEATLVVPGEAGVIEHAQLRLGSGMIMLGSIREDAFGRNIIQPDQIEGAVTQSAYLVVEDADAVYARVEASGTQVLMPIEDQGYGGRGFTCRDLEGHIWSVGTYDPWA